MDAEWQGQELGFFLPEPFPGEMDTAGPDTPPSEAGLGQGTKEAMAAEEGDTQPAKNLMSPSPF